MIGKMSGHQGDIGHDLPERLHVFVKARAVRGDSRHDGGATWSAGGSRAVGVGEENGLRGEALKVGSEALRMASKRTDPVVQVIDRDEEDVGSVRGLCFKSKGEGKESEKQAFHFSNVNCLPEPFSKRKPAGLGDRMGLFSTMKFWNRKLLISPLK